MPPHPNSSHTNHLVQFPLPTPVAEIQHFLEDFQHLKGIDILVSCAALTASTIGPGVLTHLPLTHVMELTGLQEGHALLMQVFGKEWSASLEQQHLLDICN
jgi:hypothetical protein